MLLLAAKISKIQVLSYKINNVASTLKMIKKLIRNIAFVF